MLKPIIFSVLVISIVYFVYSKTNSDFEFDKYLETYDYKPQKISKDDQPISFQKKRDLKSEPTVKEALDSTAAENIPNDKVIKSCNLILKSKLSVFQRLDSFLSSPCKEVAGQKQTLTTDHKGDSLNWITLYQLVNTGLTKLTFKEKEKLKNKLIIQLSSPGNLIQISVLSDVLITIMKKHNSEKSQEIEKLNDEMSTEVEYLGSASVGLKKNDPEQLRIIQQEIDVIKRFEKQFRLIMDAK